MKKEKSFYVQMCIVALAVLFLFSRAQTKIKHELKACARKQKLLINENDLLRKEFLALHEENKKLKSNMELHLTYKPVKTKDGDSALKIRDKTGKVLKIVTGESVADVLSLKKEIDLTGDGEKEIVIEDFTGGAHCCNKYLIFQYKSGALTQIGFLDFGNGEIEKYEDMDEDGIVEIIGSDDRLAYFMTGFANTPMLPRIIHYENGKFVECVKKFPQVLRKRADGYEKELKKAMKEWVKGCYEPYIHNVKGPALGVLALSIWLGDEKAGFEKLHAAAREANVTGKAENEIVAEFKESLPELRVRMAYENREEINARVWGSYMGNFESALKEFEKLDKEKAGQ